ncbi:MAG: MMPL family transporter, partial [bacterium]|nr:MMPL family transporter [bacterium]
MRMKFLTWLAAITYKRYLSVFTACLLITVLFGYFAGQIRMEMTWGSLVPDGEPSKETFNQVIDNFGAATQIVIALEGERKERLYTAAEELAVKLRNVTVEIPSEEGEGSLETIRAAKRVQTRLDTAFIAKHGMMLIKAKDLRNQGKAYTDYNLVQFLTNTNDVLESEYVQNTDNLTKQENESVRALDGLYDFVESIGKAADNGSITRKQIDEAVNAMTIGNGYFLSTDKKMLLIFLTPTISLNVPIDQTVAVVNAIDEAIMEFQQSNPDIYVGMTGGHVITRDEMEAGINDIIVIVIFAFIIIFLVFMLSFRMVSGPLLAMIVLIAGIFWDIGLAYLVFGRLNIITAMCAVVLVGLGVDFAIHILSAYSEFKYKGMDTEKALLKAFQRIGTGLITGAITTSAAFLALLFTSYSTYREFGFVVG